ncbi:MAG TPA: CHASE3 domain-containing protein [Methylophilaceae bacterium]|nr:CHASE3 domain-containing protein [Methylophilaceae bacterium]
MKIRDWLFWNWIESFTERLGGRVILTLSAAMVITLLAVMFTDRWIASIGEQDMKVRWIRHNINMLNELRTNLLMAESAERGYLLTQRDVYVAPFNDAIQHARDNVKAIQGLVTEKTRTMQQDNQQAWLLAVAARLEAKANQMETTLRLTRLGKFDEAWQVLQLDQGLVEMSKFLEYTQTLLDTQNEALRVLLVDRESSIVLARVALFGSVTILFLVVLMVVRQLFAEMALRDRLRLQLAQELQNYETQLEATKDLLGTLALDYQSDVERERQKLARELHDELGSILTATKMDVSWVIRKCKDTLPEITDKLKKTMRYLDQGIQFKRQVVQDLHPSMISTFGLWPALRMLIEDMAERNQWQVDILLPEETRAQVSDTIGLVAYRLVQETLNNCSKYAKAGKVSVHIMVELNFLKIEIEDDGVGMDLHTIDGTTHGLSGMRHRVMAIGGKMELVSEPGQGVITQAMIPLKTAAQAEPPAAV